jgi:hypothetical protein
MSRKTSCDIIFSKGQTPRKGFAFLQFCKKQDICNYQELASGCAFGKKHVIQLTPPLHGKLAEISSFVSPRSLSPRYCA